MCPSYKRIQPADWRIGGLYTCCFNSSISDTEMPPSIRLAGNRAFCRLRGRELIDEFCQTRLVSRGLIAVDQVLRCRLIQLLNRQLQRRLGIVNRLLSGRDSGGRSSDLLDRRSQRGTLLLVADATTFVFTEGTSGATSVRHKVVNQKTVQ